MNREWLWLMLIVALDALGRVSSSTAAETETSWTLKAFEARKQEQFAAAKQFKAFYGFQFSNQIDRSQITFHHHIVDDCARYVKATIYDHGTGLAAADVDGDGKIDLFFVDQIGGCQLWRNLGAGKFENITALAGVGL
ncbi:MAG: FG-GAP-like repeat-containing protein [Verrucomicrobiota bacterium]